MKDVLDLSALEQAGLVARGAISAEELARAYLQRIDERDAALGAIVDLQPERSIRDARAADGRTRRGDLPPFHGVPVGVKDMNFVRGFFSRLGSRAFERFYSVVDDETTQRLKRGGFVVIAKTSTSEMGAMPVVETDIHPPTRNPWNPRHTAGGSSGGAGAAVAAGMLPIAQGSDGAGSVRIPASFCGLFGFKPSRGRIPNAFGLPDRDILYTCGPLARTVDDAATMLDVLAGTLDGSHHWAPPPVRPFGELARCATPRLRVRFATEIALAPTHPEVAAAVRRVAALLAEMGHAVEEGVIGEETMGPDALQEFLPIWQFMAASAPVADFAETQPVTQWLAREGRAVTEEQSVALTRALARKVLAWFGDVDLYVTPTIPGPPPLVGAWRDLAPADAFSAAAELGPFTAPFNVTGQPAASLPAGLSSAGHPIGVQLVGKPFADGLVLAVARALEEAMPWRGMVPPSSGTA